MNTTPSDARQTASGPVMTGSQALLESFLIEGVDTLFGYPGGAIIPVCDALYDYGDQCRGRADWALFRWLLKLFGARFTLWAAGLLKR